MTTMTFAREKRKQRTNELICDRPSPESCWSDADADSFIYEPVLFWWGCNHRADGIKVERSLAMRETRVRFPVGAHTYCFSTVRPYPSLCPRRAQVVGPREKTRATPSFYGASSSSSSIAFSCSCSCARCSSGSRSSSGSSVVDEEEGPNNWAARSDSQTTWGNTGQSRK